MSDEVLIAVVAVIPTTIAAIGALWARGARTQATGANFAVNAVGKNEPTLKVRITRIEDHQGEMCRSIDRIRASQDYMTEQHVEIRGELGRLAGHIEALTERHKQ